MTSHLLWNVQHLWCPRHSSDKEGACPKGPCTIVWYIPGLFQEARKFQGAPKSPLWYVWYDIYLMLLTGAPVALLWGLCICYVDTWTPA